MMTHKIATDLQPGDRVYVGDKAVRIAHVGNGTIRNHVLISGPWGWANVARTAMVEIGGK
jgi:hypothetical protein